MKCEHGSEIGQSQIGPEGWMGGVSTCSCCQSSFGWIDSVWGNFRAGVQGGTTWEPKDKCPTCGGAYKDHGAKMQAASPHSA